MDAKENPAGTVQAIKTANRRRGGRGSPCKVSVHSGRRSKGAEQGRLVPEEATTTVCRRRGWPLHDTDWAAAHKRTIQ